MQQTVLYRRFSEATSMFGGTMVLCIKGHASAGHRVVCIAMDQMVGNRRSPGATILGSENVYLCCQPSLVRSRRQVVYILVLCGVDCVRDGRSRTS